jgi:hypothetical protein
MADFYSQNDPKRRGAEQRFDYDTSSGNGWIWGGILAVALVALIALGMSGGGTGPATGTDAAAPAETGSIQDPVPGDPNSVLQLAPEGDAAAPAADAAPTTGN